MATQDLLFQYCQKLVLVSEDKQRALLARRKGEADYDGTFSFIGGKMETTDTSLLDGMRREKEEEIGTDALVEVLPNESFNILFRKKTATAWYCRTPPAYTFQVIYISAMNTVSTNGYRLPSSRTSSRRSKISPN